MLPPQIIYVFGIDGSGKSTICRLLVQALNERGVKANYLWLRFNHVLSKAVNALGHICGLAFYVNYPDGTKVGYHHYHKSRLLSFIYAVATIIDMYFATALKIWLPLIVKREIFVVDRFIYDVMIDLSVDTRNPQLMAAWQGRILRRMLPADATMVYLGVDKEVIVRRRPDTQWDTTFDLREFLYEKVLETFPGIRKIDNNGDITVTINTIMGAVSR